jgi:hypothetical protein
MQHIRRRSIQFLIIILGILIAVTLVSYGERLTSSDENPTEEPMVASPPPEFAAAPAPSATPAHPLEVQLAWFYRPPEESLLETLPQNFDFFILGHKDERERGQLRRLGVGGPIVQYLLLTEIRDPGNCTELPFGNQVAFHAGDFCMIDSEHPDWFLLDGHGKRIGGEEVYWMDPANPGFRAFWLDRARELQEQYGWNGVFIDNAQASLGKFRSLNRLPQIYKTDAEYRAAVEGFLEYLRSNYFLPSGRKMYANITDTQDYTVWSEYLDSLDGVLVENFAAGWPGQNKSRTEWEEQMGALEEAHNRGKITILVSQGEQTDARRQQFSFASYLLIANEFSFFRYALSGSYGEIWLYENYNVNLGPPVSLRYRDGVTWRRDFLHGYVIVNPATLDAEIVAK